MTYQPRPIKTDHIALSPSLERLTEDLARSTHDHWAALRFEQGWTYGPERNDDGKKHPLLIPYEDLPDAEKQYDRQTALEAIKSIRALGYQIIDPAREQRVWSADECAANRKHLSTSLHDDNLSLAELALLRESYPPESFEHDENVFLAFARGAMRFGETRLALDLVSEGLAVHPESSGLLFQKAASFVQSGSAREARQILLGLAKRFPSTDYFLLLAEAHREEALKCGVETAEGRRHALDGARWYQDAHNRFGNQFQAGVSASVMLFLAGEKDQAQALAKNLLVSVQVDEPLTAATQDLISQAEARLVLGDYQQAFDLYIQAASTEPALPLRQLASARRLARIILNVRGVDPDPLNAAFNLPPVLAVASGLEGLPRYFPADAPFLGPVCESFHRLLKDFKSVPICYLSIYSPVDLLLSEAALQSGAEVRLLLSGPPEACLAQWRELFGETWANRLERLLAQPVQQAATSRHYPDNLSVAGAFNNRVLAGSAAIRAQELHLDLMACPVHGVEKSALSLPLRGFLSAATRAGADIRTILIPLAMAPAAPETTAEKAISTLALNKDAEGFRVGQMDADIKAMLFADVVKFSTLSEGQIPAFVREFLGTISQQVAASKAPPVVVNTWGDALYLVFDEVVSAGRFALHILRTMQEIDWPARGLPSELSLRIALHAGPVFSVIDPVTRQFSYTGGHVTQAARMEPVTAPGQVYVSGAFASLSLTECRDPRERGYEVIYVGKLETAKRFGAEPIYRLVEISGRSA